MKKTKILSLILIFMVLVSVLATSVQAASTYQNNNSFVNTSFTISDSGASKTSISYIGIDGITTGATITITISKRSWLFFWDEVVTHTLHFAEVKHSYEYKYQLFSKGTYKCEVEYVISGTGGADDVITFEDTASY